MVRGMRLAVPKDTRQIAFSLLRCHSYPPCPLPGSHHTIRCNMQYNAIQCNTMRYTTIRCNTIQYHTILCDSVSLRWQPARRREMRIHWILTATEYAVSNGGDHLSEQFLREILFKCYSGCTSKYHSSYQPFQQMLLNVSESSKMNTGKHSQLMIHMCPNHLQYTCHLLVVPSLQI